MKKRTLLLSLVMVAYSYAGGHHGTQPPPTISVIDLKKQEIDLKIILPGRVVAHTISHVRPQVDGIIQARLYKEGSYIEKDQVLYQIDPAPFKAEYQKAQADMKQAMAKVKLLRAKSKRYKKMLSSDAASEQQYENVLIELESELAAVDIARAQVKKAKIDLDYTLVKAPIAGFIGKSNFTKGALVTKNQDMALATITQLDPIYVDLRQTTSDSMSIRSAMHSRETVPVQVQLPDSNKFYKYPGHLEFSEVSVQSGSGSIGLRAVFPNPDHQLLPGMFVRANISLHQVQGFLIPQQAVVHDRKGKPQVWVVSDDNKVNPKTIKVNEAIEHNWLVTDGLPDNTKIVFEGFQKIRPGAKVNPDLIKD